MEVIRTEDASSVIVFDLRMSEGELEYIATALEYVLKHLSQEDLHRLFDEESAIVKVSDAQEFLEIMVEQATTAIRQYCIPKYLPKRFRTSVDATASSSPTVA